MSGGNTYYFSPVKPGDAITANWANSLVAMLNKMAEELDTMKSQLNQSLYQRLDAVVELTSDLSMGGSANAKILYRDTDPNTWKDGPTREITVYDAVGSFQASAGDKALAEYNKQAGIWIVWQVKC